MSATMRQSANGLCTTYTKWIAAHVPAAAADQCEVWTRLMAQAFPALRRQWGMVVPADRPPYLVGDDWAPHWWCVTADGQIVDPTAHQFPWPLLYLAYDGTRFVPPWLPPGAKEAPDA